MYVIIAALVGLAVGAAVVYALLSAKKSFAREELDRLRLKAKEAADKTVLEAELAGKEERIRLKEDFERGTEQTRQELRESEKRLTKREDNLDKKAESLSQRERSLDDKDRNLARRGQSLEDREKNLERLIQEEMDTLQRIGGLSQEEARKILLDRLQTQLQHESDALIQKAMERTKEEADTRAKEIIATALQRSAAVHTQEMVVSTIDIPGDEMKGRIIGREGRNIRAFEKATGVDVIVDDTPGVIVISGFDSIRREIARRAMQKLVADGRIHPARIEEVVADTQKEMEEVLREAGKQAAFECAVHNLHPKEVELLGRLRFRTSYGQNVLLHSTEVATLSGIMAAELGLDVQLAKRCGLLHDIGKAVDQEMEGSHVQIGADIARRFKEPDAVVNAIEGHHEDVPATSLCTVLVAAADAMSASRPGARRETLEKYIKRLEKLEEVATSYPGVESAYAIQAGREIRIIVDAGRVNDAEAARICRDCAQQIERELTYPGEVKVTLLRELRCTEFAR
ncbi:MAG: ribonuclease Y [Planctomycetota bacterium]